MRVRLSSSALLVATFLAVSVGVGSKQGLSTFDHSLWRLFSVEPGSIAHDAARFITARGVVGFLLPLSIPVGVALWYRSRSVAYAIAVPVVVQVSALVVRETKRHYMVVRPPTASVGALAHNPAFPSGHTATSTAFLVVIAALTWSSNETPGIRKTVVALAALGSIAMGWTRLALGVHWFSDVVGGWALGSSIGLAGASAAIALRAWAMKQSTVE